MLQTIHRYYRSVLGLIFVSVMGLSMLLFGVDFGSRQTDSYAIKVNDLEISFDEYYNRKREVQDRVARSFGEGYSAFAAQILQDLTERLADELVNESLIKNLALDLGMGAGKDSVKEIILNIFQNNFSAEQYSQLLRQYGFTAPQFESRIASETIINQLRTILLQVAKNPPKKFTKSIFNLNERLFSLKTIEFKKEEYIKDITEVKDEALESFYEERLLEYEQPAKASINYAIFTPEKYQDKVEIFTEDVELYYTDNQRDFTEPEQVKIKQILLSLPTGDDPAAVMGVESLADDLLKKVKSGEDINDLASKYSDDKKSGQESEWINRGAESADFERQVYSEETKENDVIIVRDENKIRIIQIAEKKSEELIPLEKVKDKIEEAVKKQQAPLYAAEKARSIFEEWQKSDLTLEKVLDKEPIKYESSVDLLSTEEAKNEIKPLIKAALDSEEQGKLIVDQGDSLVLVEVNKLQPTEIPPLKTIKDKLTNDYKMMEAKKIAEQKANKFFNAVKKQGEISDEIITNIRVFYLKPKIKSLLS